MKSLCILQSLLQDASRALDVDTTRDWETIQSRSKTEGLSLLTITLPNFGDWFFQCIEAGKVETPIGGFFGLKHQRHHRSVLPKFLFGLTSRVFDPETGQMLKPRERQQATDINAVFFIRQICYHMKKVKIECSEERTINAFFKFVETDLSLRISDRLMRFDREEQTLLNMIISDVFRSYDLGGCLPKHGPGATFEGIRGNSKFKNRTFYSRWAGIFSWEDLYGFSTINTERHAIYDSSAPTVKVIAVPKTQKGPRIIAVEPVAMQFAQQLVSARIIESFQSSSYSHLIHFNDQTCNQKAALFGSRDQSNCTIDLSEASDRISCKLVQSVLRCVSPVIRQQIFAVRSPLATIPSLGLTLTLRKFASMGSAVTFPLESIIFMALVVMIRAREIRKLQRMSRTDALKLAKEQVLIFGDDIIAPKDSCTDIINGLESYGLKVNRSKSFHNGMFRESCGVDAIAGYNITPIYVRSLLPEDVGRTPESIVATVSLANRLFFAGLPITADFVVKNVGIHLDYVGNNSPILGLHTRENAYSFTGFNNEWMCRNLKGYVATVSYENDEIDGDSALLKCLLSKAPQDDVQHLYRNVKKHALRLRKRRGSPF